MGSSCTPVYPAAFHRVAFPKKVGPALSASVPFVAEVYRDFYGANVALPPGPRARCLGRLVHITFHSIPADSYHALRWLTLVGLALFWLFLYPASLKLRTIACALAYSGLESAFTWVERGRPYTSAAQFGANLLYVPVLLDAYGRIFDGAPLLYVLCFPLNVWLLEVVVERFIVLVHGRNVAWCYKDYADECLGGCIRLGHGVAWWALGAVCVYLYPVVCDLSERVVGATKLH